MNNKPFPDFLQKLIDNVPAAGSGVHDWMFDVSRNLHAHLPAGEIESLIRSRLATCGRPVPDREIKAAIKNSMDFAWAPKNTPGNQPCRAPVLGNVIKPPAKPDLEKIERLINGDDLRVADLWHQSPAWFEDPQTEAIIDMLFPGDPLLCVGKSSAVFNTLPRSLWRGELQSHAFLVPSPMTALEGQVKDGSGRMSAHTLDNTGPRRFLVVEFDFAEYARDGITPTIWQPMLQRLKHKGLTVQDLCANLLLRLNRRIPMTLAVSSGGKSIHGWWYCAGHPESAVKQFHDYTITLGADPATFRRSQFVRMPDGTRENGNPQPVLYFNPESLPAS